MFFKIMSIPKGKRITLKRVRPNPLFQEWLEDLHEEARNKKSKLENMLSEALDSLEKYPLSLQSGAECAILKGFDKRLCLFLDQRLEVYRQNNQIATTEEPSVNNEEEINNKEDNIELEGSKEDSIDGSHSSTEDKSSSNELQIVDYIDLENETNSPDINPKPTEQNVIDVNSNKQSKSRRNPKVYKPAYRSGSYAILVALFEDLKANPTSKGLYKEKLIDKAQPHSEESFIRPKPDTHYTAWSNMATLTKKGLVKSHRSKKTQYSITDAGISLVTDLKSAYSDQQSMNDLIFNSPGSSGVSLGVLFNTNNKNDKEIANNFQIQPGASDIILLIDIHEISGISKKNDPTVAQFNKYPDLKHEYRSLNVGDFTWIARDRSHTEREVVLPYVVERKRMDDLGSSIKDGRFHEQKFRLRKCNLNNVIYLIENYGSNKHVGLPLQSLMQALANTRVQDNFKIHVTDSLTDTAKFLAMMTKRLTIEYKDKLLSSCNSEPIENNFMTFDFFNKKSSKTKPLTVTETFIKLLLQLKGVSIYKALAITSVYKTPALLIKKYGKCSAKEGELLLANLKSNDGRHVGPAVSKAVYHLFS